MRILHVITTLDTGGAEHLMVDLLPRLKQCGHDVELAVFNTGETPFYNELKAAGIKIHVFAGPGNVYNPLHIIRLARLMRNFDLIHTHNTACQMFAALARSKRNILVTTEHSTSTRRRRYAIFRYIDRWMYRRYDRIICISGPSEQSLRGYIGNDFPIVTVLNGVDVSRFSTAGSVDLGLNGKKVITMVAGFRYEKDQPTVIRALTHLPEDYHLVLVGDGERREEFESLILHANLKGRIHLLGFRTDVPQILKASDVVVMSSHREGLSLSNVEGMASGRPFVASDVEGLREVTGGYGVLFPHEDDVALADVILKLTADQAFRDTVVERCMARAKQFDIDSMTRNYDKVYKELAR